MALDRHKPHFEFVIVSMHIDTCLLNSRILAGLRTKFLKGMELRWSEAMITLKFHGLGPVPYLLKLRTKPRIIFLFFPRAARARASSSDLRRTKSAISKVPDGGKNNELLDMDSWRRTVPMKPPMSSRSMHHRESIK
jgi:hypothetical protein